MNRHGEFMHPLMYLPKAGNREIRMKASREPLVTRGKERE